MIDIIVKYIYLAIICFVVSIPAWYGWSFEIKIGNSYFEYHQKSLKDAFKRLKDQFKRR